MGYKLYSTQYKNKLFIFIYPNTNEDFIRIFEAHKYMILEYIENKFDDFLFSKVYIILDKNWQKSEAVFPFDDLKNAIILLKTINPNKRPRTTQELLFYFIHELCHLTKKGTYPLNKPPENVHKEFDKLAKNIIKKLFQN